jgi:FKBP-type peptidyl-prolyl cis-trans isomerase FklB
LCRTATSILGSSLILFAGASAQQTTGTGTTSTTKTQTGTTAHHATTTAQKPLVLATEKDKQSYAIGINVGKSLHRDDIDVDPRILLQGIKDELAGGKALMTDDEIKATLTQLGTEVRQKQEEKRAAVAESDKKAGDAFLAENATKEGVVTLPSGLEYKILTAGTGPKPTAGDMVVCNYKGTLLDGTEFDSSYKRGQPATFPVSGVIKGWTEALQLMPVGSKWQLFIPASLAYGERGQGPIAPNSTLIFEVELMSIQPRTQPEASPAAVPPPAAGSTPEGNPSATPAPATPPPATPPPAH